MISLWEYLHTTYSTAVSVHCTYTVFSASKCPTNPQGATIEGDLFFFLSWEKVRAPE
jgi:hypothetical protein